MVFGLSCWKSSVRVIFAFARFWCSSTAVLQQCVFNDYFLSKPGLASCLLIFNLQSSLSWAFWRRHTIFVWLAPFQCVSPLAASKLQSGLSSASSVASSTLRLWYDRSFFIIACQRVWGRPAGLFLSLRGTAVRILLASADSSIPPHRTHLSLLSAAGRRGCPHGTACYTPTTSLTTNDCTWKSFDFFWSSSFYRPHQQYKSTKYKSLVAVFLCI